MDGWRPNAVQSLMVCLFIALVDSSVKIKFSEMQSLLLKIVRSSLAWGSSYLPTLLQNSSMAPLALSSRGSGLIGEQINMDVMPSLYSHQSLGAKS